MIGVSESGTLHEYWLEALDWPAGQTVQAMELLSGLQLGAHGDSSPPPPAGTELTLAHRQAAEAMWHWLREKLKSVSPASR